MGYYTNPPHKIGQKIGVKKSRKSKGMRVGVLKPRHPKRGTAERSY